MRIKVMSEYRLVLREVEHVQCCDALGSSSDVL